MPEENKALMRQALTVEEICAKPLIYKGQRCITLAMMDAVHGRPSYTAGKTFHRHREKLIEGIDYFRVPWDDPVFVNASDASTKYGARTDIVLLAESGYLMLVKPWNDALAWEVQRRLVHDYFRSKALVQLSQVEHYLPVVKAMEAMGEGLLKLNGNIEVLNGNLSEMSESNRKEHDDFKGRIEKVEHILEGIQPRKYFSSTSIDQYVQTIMLFYGGDCPCCRKFPVLDKNGNKLSDAQCDHFYGSSHNAVHEGWIVCKRCNLRFYSVDGYREKIRTLFHAFHVYREQYLKSRSPRLPFDED